MYCLELREHIVQRWSLRAVVIQEECVDWVWDAGSILEDRIGDLLELAEVG